SPPSSHLLFKPTPPPAIYTLSLHDALPISFELPVVIDVGLQDHVAEVGLAVSTDVAAGARDGRMRREHVPIDRLPFGAIAEVTRSEEHTSELQSRSDLVCRLLLEKKKKYTK